MNRKLLSYAEWEGARVLIALQGGSAPCIYCGGTIERPLDWLACDECLTQNHMDEARSAPLPEGEMDRRRSIVNNANLKTYQ